MKPYENRELLYQKVIVEGKSYQQTAKEIGCSYTAVRNWCMKFGFTRIPKIDLLDMEHGEEIVDLYVNKGLFLKDIANKYNVHYDTIRIILKRHGIKLKNRSEIKRKLNEKEIKRVYQLNENYFKNWSSNMAYILGFIAADGCILNSTFSDGKTKNLLRINLQATDAELLEKIKDELNYKGDLTYFKAKLKDKEFDTVSLAINSKIIIEDLKKLGITERKSKTISMPPDIPEEYELDFIRGYFDGDGSIGGQYPTNSRGTKTKKLQIRFRIFSGSKTILEQFNKIFVKHGLKSKSVNKHGKSLYEILYSTNESILIYDLLYKDKNAMFLKRKQQKFSELISKRLSQL